MIKILFLIHDLGQGGAEKVLLNLVNNMDRTKFDISVTALFGGGVNEQFLKPHIHYQAIWGKVIPGNSTLMKLFSPNQLHRICVKDDYDIEVAYLEGPAARVISGCENRRSKLISWIHVEQHTMGVVAKAFRNEAEARRCYRRFDRIIAVSQYVMEDFCGILGMREKSQVIYNTIESDKIRKLSREDAAGMQTDGGVLKLIAVGTLKRVKGYDRLLRIVQKLKLEGYPVCLFILGMGPMEEEIRELIKQYDIERNVRLLGYQTNPYKYVSKADLFVCASHSEGFSTAATEALIVGTPVCTVEVSGMKEMLGENNEYGVVTENNEEALYQGVKGLLDAPQQLAYYKIQAEIRGQHFSLNKTVDVTEKMFIDLRGEGV